MSITKTNLSHNECLDACRRLFSTLTQSYEASNFKGIGVVLNGGMIPSYWIRKLFASQGLKLPMELIDVQSYDGMKQGALSIEHLPTLKNEGAGWIIVDEICDTGETLKALKSAYPNAITVSLCVKEKGKDVPHHYVHSYDDSEWIVFPWEIEEDC